MRETNMLNCPDTRKLRTICFWHIKKLKFLFRRLRADELGSQNKIGMKLKLIIEFVRRKKQKQKTSVLHGNCTHTV